MPISRRKLLGSALAGTTLAAVGGTELVSAFTSPASAASAAGDVVGKITVGYQGWFACIGDGAPINAWWHWSQNEAAAPSPSNENLKAWPDMTIYNTGYPTAYANLNNGGAPNLFSSYDQQVLNTHCSLMQANGIDTIALQRFDPNGSEGPTRNAVTAKLNTAAQGSGRKFYIMYDASGWTNMKTEMPADWTNVMSQYASSSAYAQAGRRDLGLRLQRRQPPVVRGGLPVRHPVVPEPGLLRDGRRAHLLAHRRERLASRIPQHLLGVQHDLAVDGRTDRHGHRLEQLLHQRERRRPGVLQLQ